MEVDSLVISLGLDVEKVRQGVMQVDGFLKQLGQHIGVFMQEFQRGFTEAANAITQASTAATQQANAAAEAAREAGQRFQEAGCNPKKAGVMGPQLRGWSQGATLKKAGVLRWSQRIQLWID